MRPKGAVIVLRRLLQLTAPAVEAAVLPEPQLPKQSGVLESPTRTRLPNLLGDAYGGTCPKQNENPFTVLLLCQ